MKKRARLWLVLLMVSGMALSFGGVARGQTNPFPSTKEPSSARFDISGLSSTLVEGDDVGGQSFTRISGNGAISGKNMQLDMTMSMEAPETAGLPPDPSDPGLVRISIVLLDGKLYFKLPSLTGEDKWVVTDAGGLTTGNLMGGMGFGPDYTGAFTVTEEGKETLNGVQTTRYRIDANPQSTVATFVSADGTLQHDEKADTQIVVYMWVGDSDMYLHKIMTTVNNTSQIVPLSDSAPNRRTTTTSLEVTIAFREFDRPVTITSPPNAQELDLSSLGIDPGMLAGGGVLGMPGTVAAGVGLPVPRIGTGAVGMPRTGSPSSSFPSGVMAATAIGLLCLLLGGLARRAGARS